MKRLLSLLALLAFFTACVTTPVDVEEDATEAPEVATLTSVELDKLSFEIPEGWTLVEGPTLNATEEEVTFQIPHDTYDVTLMLQLVETDGPSEIEWMGDPTQLQEDLMLAQVGCGGGLPCFEFQSEGYYAHAFFYPESTEPTPEDLDGPWAPDTGLMAEDLTAFLETATLNE